MTIWQQPEHSITHLAGRRGNAAWYRALRRSMTLIGLLAASLSLIMGTGAEAANEARPREVAARITPILRDALETADLLFGAPLFIRIFKESRELELWLLSGDGFRLFRRYPICAYATGYVGPKTKRQDKQSPEGFYFISKKRLIPNDRFHLALNIGYPNHYDRANKRRGGRAPITIRGGCFSDGSYAMTDAAIEEIYTLVEATLTNGHSLVRVHIFPFPLTEVKLQRYDYSKWFPFWRNLQDGYIFFEEQRQPPNIKVSGGKYTFEPLAQ